ncbi:VHS domain-containing protein [Suillus subaureus]|uniref:VHS domain-containing protein n=1 Tax=Suillus subaureus TaxID=48587 RepID=A0A9P7E901_9AGAM|nr:VHS domain-containing protein [Suillus subaureus]KAG1814754.1 VHS domain-containing protein [Suillus subaureus]
MMLGGSNGTAWFRASKLEMLTQNACDPTLHEPNYAIHLEIAELINTKKANTPREAAMLIARLANHRNPHIAILALALLDTLVQSCGYPFHLQISTKEFLNELVRRFPERPPPFPGPVMSRILELIHRWKEGICSESRWKEDLGNIKDMHRLLTFKGYRFREIPRRVDAPPTMNIKSADELESEDREAQSAKLQELIRRGTPRDLVVAQELMKSLAGANPEAKPDYHSQAMTELDKLESKVILLNEMLDNVDTAQGEKFASGDAYDQVASILGSARPKLQKWVSDAETDDPESLDAFLQINDRINNVITRFEAFKKGDYSISAVPAELAQTEGSLINFDDTSYSSSQVAPANDLASLFASPPQPQSYARPSSASAMFASQLSASLTNNASSSTSSPVLNAPSPQPQFGSIMLAPTPPRVTSPSYIGGNNGGTSPPNSNSTLGMGLPGLGMSRPPAMGMSTVQNGGLGIPMSTPGSRVSMGAMMGQTQPTSTPPTQQGKDPFADLAGLF